MSPHRLNTPTVRQFAKYGVVGASNTAIGFLIYVLLVVALGVPYLLASGVGYVTGSLNSYLLNRHWTFRATHIPHGRAAVRFGVVQVGAIAANVGMLYVLVHEAHVQKILAQAIVTVAVVSVTFGVNRAWAFSHHPPEPLPDPAGAP